MSSVDGVERFDATLGLAAARLDDLAMPSESAAREVIGVVDAPVRTGALAATVRVEAGPLGFALLAGSTRVGYAAAVHARNPFLTDALDRKVDEVVDHYASHVDDALALIEGA